MGKSVKVIVIHTQMRTLHMNVNLTFSNSCGTLPGIYRNDLSAKQKRYNFLEMLMEIFGNFFFLFTSKHNRHLFVYDRHIRIYRLKKIEWRFKLSILDVCLVGWIWHARLALFRS